MLWNGSSPGADGIDLTGVLGYLNKNWEAVNAIINQPMPQPGYPPYQNGTAPTNGTATA